jgi:hypothetical protein
VVVEEGDDEALLLLLLLLLLLKRRVGLLEEESEFCLWHFLSFRMKDNVEKKLFPARKGVVVLEVDGTKQ